MLYRLYIEPHIVLEIIAQGPLKIQYLYRCLIQSITDKNKTV